MTVRIDGSLDGIDWAQAKADLAADEFDNGRSAEALRRSFEHSQHVAFARDGERLVGMARLLSDGVCNAYLVDVWTASAYRRRGVASAMVRHLLDRVPGQHVGLQTDDRQDFYARSASRSSPSSSRSSSARGSTTTRIAELEQRDRDLPDGPLEPRRR